MSYYSFQDGTEHQVAVTYKAAETWIEMQLPFLTNALGLLRTLWQEIQFSVSEDSNWFWHFPNGSFSRGIWCKQISLKIGSGSSWILSEALSKEKHLCVCHSLDQIVRLYWFLTLCPCLSLSLHCSEPSLLWIRVFSLLRHWGPHCRGAPALLPGVGRHIGQRKKQKSQEEQDLSVSEFLFQKSFESAAVGPSQLWKECQISAVSEQGVCGGGCCSVTCEKLYSKKCLFLLSPLLV